MDGADGLVSQPGDHDFLVRGFDRIGEMAPEGIAQFGGCEKIRSLGDMDRLDFTEQREVGLKIARNRCPQRQGGVLSAHGSRRN